MKDLVLIAEDDRELSSIIMSYLEREGFAAAQVFDGEKIVKETVCLAPKAVLLDIMLPNFDGIEVLKELRLVSSVPVVVISAKSAESDKLLMLGLGADDYMVKPFSMREMVARVKGQIRRGSLYGAVYGNARTYGALTVDPDSFKASAGGAEIPLTAKEFKLLDFLTANAGKVFSKSRLLDSVWGYDGFFSENTVSVSIARLREKLSAYGVTGIKTVWGVGYKWQE